MMKETINLISKGLLGKGVLIQQGDGGESSSCFVGRVTRIIRPDCGLPYWEIELDDNGKSIPVQDGITEVIVISSRNN